MFWTPSNCVGCYSCPPLILGTTMHFPWEGPLLSVSVLLLSTSVIFSQPMFKELKYEVNNSFAVFPADLELLTTKSTS
ncbi:hypothetical protein L596_003022 [Steinernema carpocapsae]|uniref:Uncharacterized protein n=1 Tax=Steinernema carpocapsae TaxID=34508 RepID=A0A4U8UR85_STECR|nr:hypothetical protein L596_003022 [Steinernema carpocapsae]